MDILQILTTGITGTISGILLVFLAINFLKAGWFGSLSRWIINIDKTKNKEKYGGRVLFIAFIFSLIINLIQLLASPESMTIAMYFLRVIGCCFMSSGGYEYIKTVAKNMPDFKEGE